ncbi:23S rRNA (adenine(2503)-C(2))-methyltransferase RlmN [bacterium]|nr:23S rRNA (adenine(2503)-C(2))-methyltransferase RlmN [bacterium]
MDKTNLYDLDPARMTEWVASLGEPAYRAKQIIEWLYEKDIGDADRMSNLPAEFRRSLKDRSTAVLPEVGEIVRGADGTEKILLRLAPTAKPSGKALKIECVLMPAEDRTTLCVSSQAGCALDCVFCATATMGFKRNLTCAEIIGQVIVAKRHLAKSLEEETGTRRLSNIVFMGMGEPLLNFDSLCRSLRILTGKDGMGMSPSRITVSTAGVADRLLELAEGFAVNIAISLNAPSPDLRARIMPRVSARHDLDALLEAARQVGKTRRKPVTFEYVLLAGVTDRPEQARELVKLISRIRCKVNLIPFNPFPGSDYRRPEPQEVLAFQKILWDADIPTYIRWSQGLDVRAACGQLAISSR